MLVHTVFTETDAQSHHRGNRNINFTILLTLRAKWTTSQRVKIRDNKG